MDGGGLSLSEHPAIAVLPFDDMSATHDQQYLADGITEELITGLAKFPEFLVMARNATLAYKDKPMDIRQVGKDLNVRYVVEGSIQRSDQNVRVTAQLIDASTGSQLWADRYDREATGIFAIRDDITRAIAGVLGGMQGKVGQAEAARVSAKNPNSFTAYDYVMRGWYELYKYDRAGNTAARDLFEQAKKIDPSYARAYAGLAWTYADDYYYQWTDDYDKTLKLALENASTAVRLDPNDYQAHWVLGWAYLYNRQHEQAMASTCAPENSIRTTRSYSRKWVISSSTSASQNKPSTRSRRQSGSIQTTRSGMLNIWDGPMKRRHASRGHRDSRTGDR